MKGNRSLSLRQAAAALAIGTSVSLATSSALAVDRKFALSMFHFNIQYVAGGLTAFFPDTKFDRDEKATEDIIIKESFDPVLDMLLAHPTWGHTLELQGRMIEVIAERHPQTLDKLRTLTARKQVELVSFHYSDQFFIAYPAEDWRRSQALNRKVFERAGLPLSNVVFCQEGQASLGFASAMKETGYGILVWPRNLFGYQRGTEMPQPLYTMGDALMITSHDLDTTLGADKTDKLEVKWTFFDDGELMATGGSSPYLVEDFVYRKEAITAYEGRVSALETSGFRVSTIADYVTELKSATPPVNPPELVDGTWQPKDTDSAFKWMGGRGIWGRDERDNDVRTFGAIAHRAALGAATAAKIAGRDESKAVDESFRLLALGQVSDGTGINPFRGEMEYSIAHLAEAVRVAKGAIERSAPPVSGESACVDTGSAKFGARPFSPASTSETIPIQLEGGSRASKVQWFRYDPEHSEVRVRFEAGDGEPRVHFTAESDTFSYSRALTDSIVSAARSSFAFDHIYLPLHDGLIGIGPDLFVIKDQSFVHLAARIERDTRDVSFGDNTLPPLEAAEWRFHVVRGSAARAHEIARGINVAPVVCR